MLYLLRKCETHRHHHDTVGGRSLEKCVTHADAAHCGEGMQCAVEVHGDRGAD